MKLRLRRRPPGAEERARGADAGRYARGQVHAGGGRAHELELVSACGACASAWVRTARTAEARPARRRQEPCCWVGSRAPGTLLPDSPDLTFSKKFPQRLCQQHLSVFSSEWEGGGGGSRGAGCSPGAADQPLKSQDSLRVCGWPALGTALLPSACVGAFPGYPVGEWRGRLPWFCPRQGQPTPGGRGRGPCCLLAPPRAFLCFSLSGTESFVFFVPGQWGGERANTQGCLQVQAPLAGADPPPESQTLWDPGGHSPALLPLP